VSTRTSHARTLPAAVGCCLLAVVAVLAAALPASASAACTTLKPKSNSAPYLLSPCDGASVPEHRSVTFVVYDSDAQTRQSTDYPYLDLATDRDVTHGQLAASTNGTGVFQQLSPRPGHKDEWTLAVKPQTYRAWWDNHAGTCFVQIRQLDPTATDGVTDSPIVTLHVAAAGD